MQTLYTVITLNENPSEKNLPDPQQILARHFDQTRALFVYLIYFLTELARYAETDAHQRASKHLPSAEDLHVNTRIAGNLVLWKMLEDGLLKDQLAKDKPQLHLDRELLRKLFHNAAEQPYYRAYTEQTTREKHEERRIMEFLANDVMLADEGFLSHVEDLFSNWQDDGEMLAQLLAGYLQKPGSYNFSQLLSPDKSEFARSLLRTVLEKDEQLQSLIIPKLKNWDPERIALLDMIMMKMGVAEFLYFETIPPKVTINEYIDLAKEYSTAQSGQFVNGILDNIHKDLVQQGKMQKVDYKKV